MLLVLALLLVAAVAAAAAAAAASVADFTPQHELRINDAYLLEWAIDPTPAAETITFRLTVATRGWLGFGLSPTGDMVGADVVLAFVGDDGVGYASDRFAEAKREPRVDASQDYELLAAEARGGSTIVTLRRAWRTCDEHGDRELFDGTQRLVWSYHESQRPASAADADAGGAFERHTHRGTVPVNLLSVAPGDGDDDDDAEAPHRRTLDIAMEQLALPARETSYMCRAFALDDALAAAKNQLVAFAPLFTPGNEDYVHHFLLYACEPTLSEEELAFVGDCYGSAMPPKLRRCNFGKVVAVWAVGGREVRMPRGVGLPFGGAGGDRQFLLEMHYNAVPAGVVDSSGVRITYVPSPHLRAIDAGVLATGHSVSASTLVVPPRLTVNVTGFCTPACTSHFDAPLRVFSVVLHAHYAGRALYSRLLRADGSDELLAANANYDFNFQDAMAYRDEREIRPGDALALTCTYTNTHDEPVLGGLSTEDEMCLAYYFYYPAQRPALCITDLNWRTLLTSLRDDGVFARLPAGAVDDALRQPSSTFWHRYNTLIDWERYAAPGVYERACRQPNAAYDGCRALDGALVPPGTPYRWPDGFEPRDTHVPRPSLRRCPGDPDDGTAAAAGGGGGVAAGGGGGAGKAGVGAGSAGATGAPAGAGGDEQHQQQQQQQQRHRLVLGLTIGGALLLAAAAVVALVIVFVVRRRGRYASV